MTCPSPGASPCRPFRKMAESAEARPSMEGILGVLARVPEDRLIRYKHKLSCMRQDRRSCQLLHAMILLTLRREADARVSLEAFGDDAAAACIYRSRWGSREASRTNPIPPTEEAGVALAVARIYSLLVDEKLCSPRTRDGAYQEAFKAYQVSGIQGAKLKSLSDEAQEKCGLDFMLTVASIQFGAPGSGAEGPLPRAARTPPVPINTSWDPSDLRSTGSPTSLLSHLEISQSLTGQFLTDVVDHCGIPETGNPCGSPPSPSATVGEQGAGFGSLGNCYPESPVQCPAQARQPPQRGATDFYGGHSHVSVPTPVKVVQPLEAVVQHPVKCTELPSTGQQDLGGSVPSNRQPSLTSRCGSGAGDLQRGVGESPSPPQSTGPRGQSPSSSAPPPRSADPSSTDPPCAEQPFFTFVVLHASEDEAIACRVKERLETMDVSNGATFSEDFLVPGHGQLNCFQDALDNAAYTLVLLTENFKGHLCAYQTNVALMDSFSRFMKNHTVIPFVPKENPIKRAEMPILLAGLVPLDENSPVFATRVKKTFTAAAIREKKRAWSLMRQIQERERLQEQQRNYLQALHRLAALNVNLPGFAGLQVPPGHVPQPFSPPTFTAPGIPQPAPDLPSLTQPLMVSMSGGPQPHLIIQHAQMVQIGDYNHMQVERTNAVLGTDGQEAGEDWRM
ncbi:TIR domain-containing adapter molecule 1 [Elgaria multicarinata webbii]|uniref:TIR domain-containing adapter molecule 1 n=1 Tax=Elgaria multicarinata webbii TaxID=159646 RepID=UPI002FCD020C